MGCGTTCVKSLMYFINILFVLVGIVLIVSGAVTLARVNKVSDFTEGKFSASPIVLIVLGVIVFIIAFFGCYGTIRENSCMLTTFAIILMVILVVEVIFTILIFVYYGEDKNGLIQTQLKKAYDNWPQKQYEINGIQRYLECCGLNDSSSFPGPLFPPSCCGRGDTESSCTSKEIYHIGCRQPLVDWINKLVLISGCVSIGFAVVLVFGITMGLWMANSFQHKRYTV